MKFLCINFLIFFISFLSTPTIVSIVDNEADISYFYNLCEEEENLEFFDKIKSVSYNNFELNNRVFKLPNSFNFSVEANLTFTNLAHQIFSPPPNLV